MHGCAEYSGEVIKWSDGSNNSQDVDASPEVPGKQARNTMASKIYCSQKFSAVVDSMIFLTGLPS